MARIQRVVAVGCPHHITQRGNFRRDIFYADQARSTYLALPADSAGAHNAPRPIVFVVPGEALPGGVSGAATTRGAGGAPSAGFTAQVKSAVRVATLRGAGDAQRLAAVPGEDIVALHIAGGPVLYLHPENGRDLLLAQTAAGAAGMPRGAADAAGAAPAPNTDQPPPDTIVDICRHHGVTLEVMPPAEEPAGGLSAA